MKITPQIILLCVLSFILTGCPVAMDYPLVEKNTTQFDERLYGTWTNEQTSHEAHQVTIISNGTTTSARMTVDVKGEVFSPENTEFDVWLCEIKSYTYLVVQEIKEEIPQESYYNYYIKIEAETVSTADPTLKVNGTDGVTSTETYQDEIRASMEFDDFLSGLTVWTKK